MRKHEFTPEGNEAARRKWLGEFIEVEDDYLTPYASANDKPVLTENQKAKEAGESIVKFVEHYGVIGTGCEWYQVEAIKLMEEDIKKK